MNKRKRVVQSALTSSGMVVVGHTRMFGQASNEPGHEDFAMLGSQSVGSKPYYAGIKSRGGNSPQCAMLSLYASTS